MSSVRARIGHRLLCDVFSSFQVAFSSRAGNFTLLGARPTRGVYQIDAMGELDLDLFYGAYTASINRGGTAGQFRLFGLGYVDQRSSVLKTDNRSTALRSADRGPLRIATFGADYVHVFNTQNHGKFDFLLWGRFRTAVGVF